MRNLIIRLSKDEAGFIISSELVLVGTIAVLSLVVGLAELSSAVNHELRDCAGAFGSTNSSGNGYQQNWNDGDDWNGQDMVGASRPEG